MARHDDLNACGVRLHVELREIVDCIDEDLADLNELGLAEARRPRPAVVVASHCGNRRDGRERLEHAGIAEVAAVNDAVAALEELDCLGTQETMCVRDKAYAKQSMTQYRIDGKYASAGSL